jgi:dTDP-4-dehydrorhamnose 3,5-epimerase
MTQPRKDRQTVTAEGSRLDPVIDGVKIRYTVTQVDERGSLAEIFDPSWKVREEPLAYIYTFTIRPGKTKGWIKHEMQADCIFLVSGTVKFVLFDDRRDSPTYRMINEHYLSDSNRGLITYPAGIYHALQNIGESTATMVNMPTRAYNHNDPDKYRLPLDTDYIPYRFDANPLGW